MHEKNLQLTVICTVLIDIAVADYLSKILPIQ